VGGRGGGWRKSKWGIYFICNKEEEWSHIVRWKVTKIWRVQTLDKRFRNIRDMRLYEREVMV